MNDLGLEDLLKLAKAGEGAARAELCGRFSRSTGDEDLRQEERFAVLRAIDEYDPRRGTFAWLVARRKQDAVRKISRGKTKLEAPFPEEIDWDQESGERDACGVLLSTALEERATIESEDAWDELVSEVDREDLQVVISAVLTSDDQVFLASLLGLWDVPKKTQVELAAELGISQPAVANRVARILAKLRRADWQAIVDRELEQFDPMQEW